MTTRRETSRTAIHAHRGASACRPENTMAAFIAARQVGADAIEFDVHATADGHLVVTHDYDLSRTTSGSGMVHERDLVYVRSLSAGAWFSEAFETERIPLLEEVLALEGLDFELEVKGLPTAALVDAIAAVVTNAEVVERIEFTGLHLVALTQLRQRLPDARFGLFSPVHRPWMTDRLYEQLIAETALLSRFNVVHIPTPLLPRVDVDRLHDRDLSVHAGDSNTNAELIEVLARGVDQLTTNDPEVAIRLREADGIRSVG